MARLQHAARGITHGSGCTRRRGCGQRGGHIGGRRSAAALTRSVVPAGRNSRWQPDIDVPPGPVKRCTAQHSTAHLCLTCGRIAGHARAADHCVSDWRLQTRRAQAVNCMYNPTWPSGDTGRLSSEQAFGVAWPGEMLKRIPQTHGCWGRGQRQWLHTVVLLPHCARENAPPCQSEIICSQKVTTHHVSYQTQHREI